MLTSSKVSVLLLLLLLLFVVVAFPFYELELAMQLWCCFDIALLTDFDFCEGFDYILHISDEVIAD